MGLLEDARNIQRKDPAARSVLEVILLYPGFHILVYHRIAHWLFEHKHFFLARWVSQRGRHKTGIEIHPGACIGKGFFIDHGDGVAIGRGCQGRPWLFADIKHAFEGSTQRINPTLGEVCAVIERHAELLTRFYDGDERMAVHDLRKHVAWYLKGFPVGGSTRKAFMECESLDDVRREIGWLDPNMVFPQRVVDKPRGRVRFAKKVHVPYGWLESRTTTHEEREMLFGDDPMDAGY